MPRYHATAKRSARNYNTAVLTGFAESPSRLPSWAELLRRERGNGLGNRSLADVASNPATAVERESTDGLVVALGIDEVDAPVCQAILRRCLRGDLETRLAEAYGHEAVAIDALRDQPLRDGIRASFAELHVVRVVAAGVGVTFDAEFGDPRRPQMLVNQLENGVALWLQGRLVFVENYGSRQFETVEFDVLNFSFLTVSLTPPAQSPVGPVGPLSGGSPARPKA